MLPHTRMFLDAVREEQEPPMLEERGEAVRDMDPGNILVMKARKKQQLAILKRMMADAGYADLARMTSLQRGPEDDAEEYFR